MSRKKTQKNKEVDINLYVFSNDTQDQGTVQLLQMFYRGAYSNSVGIMRALNTSTDKVESILVGLEVEEGETKLIPLAKVLEPQDVPNYLSPNGKGGWFGRDDEA